MLTLITTIMALWYAAAAGADWRLLLCAAALLIIPLSDFALQVVNWCAAKLTAPQPLPKLDFEHGIPPDQRVLVTVQAIFSSRRGVEDCVRALEVRALGNNDPNIGFGILADLADAPHEVLPGDAGTIKYATSLIEDLNRRLCNGQTRRFFITFRQRRYNSAQGCFLGWERKRGKIEEFNRWLRGAVDTTFSVIVGDVEFMRSARYVLTLDSDTQLPPATAYKLVGTAAHPLNQPVFDPVSDCVIDGYAIIQPRVGTTLQSGTSSLFSYIFSGHSGLDPYTRMVSDIYQDLFREGSFIGKAIYNIDAFHRALHNRFPENALLSHDLIESLFARCGLASDIEIFDDHPMRYHAQARRLHRWIRGDWQLLPWMAKRIPNGKGELVPSPISALGHWKLVDNLRRSVLPITQLGLLLAIWLLLPGDPVVWMTAAALVLLFPVYTVLWSLIADLPIGLSITTYLKSLWSDLSRNTLHVLLQISFLPHQAWLSGDAIVRTLYRLYFSKRHLLEWEAADLTARRLAGNLMSFVSEMWQASAMALLAAALISHYSTLQAQALALPFLLLWLLSPLIAWWCSAPFRRRPSVILNRKQERYLRRIAYATWRYFEHFLKPEYNYLIPDNVQIVPERAVAERTSPTNIGLSISSVISAYDLGFQNLPATIERLASIMDNLLKLERFHGHFLNWYAIRDYATLQPRYISSVDSGNLVGHLIAARQSLSQFLHEPLVDTHHCHHLAQLFDELDLVSSASEKILSGSSRCGESVQSMLSSLQCFRQLENELLGNGASSELRATISHLLEVEQLFPWLRHVPFLKHLGQQGVLPSRISSIDRVLNAHRPTLASLAKFCAFLKKWIERVDTEKLHKEDQIKFAELTQDLETATVRVQALICKLNTLTAQCSSIIDETDFSFLFDPKKRLLSIGFNVDQGQRDKSYYDFLASEARLAVLVAIIKGDIPLTAWFILDRSLTPSPGGKALLSWSGTMFEYLMPLLVTKSFEPTLLSETYAATVRAQQKYTKTHSIPWGISESAYSGVDFSKAYQYKAFGVPGLGLKRGLANDLVISPYSTMLALEIDPQSCVQNLRALERSGARGEFGFYEAIDYTPDRLGPDEDCHVVKSFLAHHQGMSLVALNNALQNRIFQQRFHADRSVRAYELLLQERFPTRIPLFLPNRTEVEAGAPVLSEERAQPVAMFKTAHTRYPHTRLLSNGRYSVMIDNAGSGVSFYRGEVALTRWRDDALANNHGSFIYVRDLSSRAFWSCAYQPCRSQPSNYQAALAPDKAVFTRKDRDISTQLEITVSPEDDVEVRRVTISNFSSSARALELTSYGEVSLASFQAERAHPAYSHMFVTSEFLPEYGALIFERRQHHSQEGRLFMMHLLSGMENAQTLQYETSRSRFLGRAQNSQDPLAMQYHTPLSRTCGTVLDPVFALRTRLEVPSHSTRAVSFVTGVAESREGLIDLVRKYREGHWVSRAFEMAWSVNDLELRHQLFSVKRVRAFHRLATALFYNIEPRRASADLLKRNRLGQSGLWRFGVSGDKPIVFLTVNDHDQLGLVEDCLLAHEYLRQRGVYFDLIILNENPGGYLQELQQEVELRIRTSLSQALMEKPGGVFLRTRTQLSDEEIVLLHAAARAVLIGGKGSFSKQLEWPPDPAVEVLPNRITPRKQDFDFEPPREDPEFLNGFGGFADGGKSYALTVRHDSLPPAPWINVISNPSFGCLVTESGASYTWAGNSRENRLSPWSNDPVEDPLHEVLYIRDRVEGVCWSPTPRPFKTTQRVRVKHSFGYSEFTTQVNRIFSHLTISVAHAEPVKWWHLELVNGDAVKRNLEIFLYVEWVLGVNREDTFRYLQSGFDQERQFLFATNPFNPSVPEQVVFLGSNLNISTYTSDRHEFLGRHRDISTPQALEAAYSGYMFGDWFGSGRELPVNLSCKTGAGFDSCALLKVELDLEPGQRQHLLFFMAQATSLEEARERAPHYRSLRTWSTNRDQTRRSWSNALEQVQVHTPDRAFDLMVNGWLLYQTIACRMQGRSAFYQSSGAIGFRDQLQDSLALLATDPAKTRQQILLHAGRQFLEGDVQHWWHPPHGQGVRSRMTDDLLWLPFAVDQYLTATSDYSLLDEQVPFLRGNMPSEDQPTVFEVPEISNETGSIYEHCIRALERSLKWGPHGLPLIGDGDWNDGFSNIGTKGKGESVWLGWFISYLLGAFSRLAQEREDPARAKRYTEERQRLAAAIEQYGWDGEWYRRAYFDDGTPLGSTTNKECRIDSIAQSWSVMSGVAPLNRQKQAIESAYQHLVCKQDALVLLLTPPFDKSDPSPGYIQGYPRGLRENGGQYTHASTWLIWAMTLLGEGDRALELFQLINPINHALDHKAALRYKTEPYVLCGDVYSEHPHVGRGGWSWYTGSSSWAYRAAIEQIIGIKLRGHYFTLYPCVSAAWKEFSIRYRRGHTEYEIQVLNPEGVQSGVKSVVVDGTPIADHHIPLPQDLNQTRKVRVVVRMG
ncbi:MAG: hypothetical protein GX589_04380, partial [Deltaproteobacteria bacterium]|nr:hypothetical protein [Deltaproteobacteria bacterium]